ncbi:MAG: hypothetical protein F6K00_30465 [Leptolyngbya sp. SIOISBB]|nr:hypothetical protein [Leptolyngbya sp. SIOISBB]
MAKKLQERAQARWRKTLLKGTLWLSSELVLGMIGMDTMADYGEFLMQHQVTDHINQAIATITTVM